MNKENESEEDDWKSVSESGSAENKQGGGECRE